MGTEDTAKINPDVQSPPEVSVADQAVNLIRGLEARTVYFMKRSKGLERELAEMKSAYLDVSAHNAKLASQLIALRVAVRELAGPTEGPQEVPQPKDTPEKAFEERRGHTCGCDVSVPMMREEDVPEEVKPLIAHLIRAL